MIVRHAVAGVIGATGLVLAGCGQPSEPSDSAADPAQAPVATPGATAPASPSQAAAVSPLGAGSALKGGVSGLTGQITAFQVRQTATSTIVELAADVLFEFDSAALSAGAPEQLRKTVAVIQQGGEGPVRVVGHTDSVGTDAYNLDLSQRRAQAVSAWLSSEGEVPTGRLQAQGRGEAEPKVPNATTSGSDDPDGRAQNRRVEVIVPRG